jgi:choice-of-anchor A domain-containing protein
LFAIAFLAALCILAASRASAAPIVDLGRASQYALFVLGSPDGTQDRFSMNNSAVHGSIAAGAGTTYNWSGGGGPYGPNVFYQTGQPTPPVASLGGSPTPTATATDLTGAISDALAAAAQIQGLTATQTLAAINNSSGTTTITGGGGGTVNVIDVPSINISGGQVLLSGGPNEYFIIRLTNSSGTVFHASGLGINLSGGVTASHVLYYTGATGVTINGPNGGFNGTFFCPNSDFNFDNITINGAVIGSRATSTTGTLNPTAVSGVNLNYVPFQTIPEPASALICGVGALLALIGRRSRRS